VKEVDRKSYPQDVSDEEWAFVLPYLLLSREDSHSRKYSLRELFNGVRYIVRTGNQWRYMPNDLPPWPAVYQQMRRWMEAGVFEILVADVQQVTGNSVELAYVDQGYTGENAAQAAAEHGIRLSVIKHPMAKRGFVLLPKRWVVERSFAWAARFRRLARDYERLDSSLKGFHYIAFACIMIARICKALA
jgi:transposase